MVDPLSPGLMARQWHGARSSPRSGTPRATPGSQGRQGSARRVGRSEPLPGLGGSGVGLYLPGRGDNPGVIPISERRSGVRGSARDRPTVYCESAAPMTRGCSPANSLLWCSSAHANVSSWLRTASPCRPGGSGVGLCLLTGTSSPDRRTSCLRRPTTPRSPEVLSLRHGILGAVKTNSTEGYDRRGNLDRNWPSRIFIVLAVFVSIVVARSSNTAVKGSPTVGPEQPDVTERPLAQSKSKVRRLVIMTTYAGAVATLLLVLLLAIRTEHGSVDNVYLVALFVIAIIGLIALLGSLGDMTARATLGASLFGGALVAGAILLIQANSDHHRDVIAASQARAEDKRNFVLSLILRRNVSGLNFAHRDFSHQDVGGLIFRDSHFLGANLTDTGFSCADLTGATFSPALATAEDQPVGPEAIVTGADFSGAVLSRAELSELDLRNTYFGYAIMEHADLSGAKIGTWDNVDADGANLAGARFGHSQLSDVSLRGANLSGADLSYAGIGGSDPPLAVYNEDLYGPVDLRGADLRSANFSHADMTGALLTGAIANNRTQWPKGFDPQRHGVQFSGRRFIPNHRIIPLPESGCPQ